jgi:hypothetical protein
MPEPTRIAVVSNSASSSRCNLLKI